MFKGANTVGALPLTDEHPSWLPVDFAGRAITEIVLRSESEIPKSTVYHIVNPNTSASWADILEGLKDAGVKFDTVDRMEWLERLAASEKDPERNPIIKLLVRPYALSVFFALLVELKLTPLCAAFLQGPIHERRNQREIHEVCDGQDGRCGAVDPCSTAV